MEIGSHSNHQTNCNETKSMSKLPLSHKKEEEIYSEKVEEEINEGNRSQNFGKVEQVYHPKGEESLLEMLE